MSSGISAVFQAIQHRSASHIARGELIVDREFARKYLIWRGQSTRNQSDCQLLRSVCQALHLDLVCVQEEGPGRLASVLPVTTEEIRQLVDCGLFVFWLVGGPFQTLMSCRGMKTVLKNVARAPETIGEAIRQYGDSLTAEIRRGLAAGAHGIILADDIAYANSTYIPPAFVAQYLVPEWQKQVAVARELGAPIFFHSDGNLTGVLDLIVTTGFDGLQCIEPASGMDIHIVRRQYGQQLCLMGNIDPRLLVEQDEAAGQASGQKQLHRAVHELVAAMGPSGFIFGTCSGLHERMSPRLVHEMYMQLP